MTVDLSSCAQEPIHTPQAIQAHGALLVFDAASRLVAFSANAAAFLGRDVALGLHADRFGAIELADALAQVFGQERGEVPEELMIAFGDDEHALEATVHAYGGHALVEFERRGDISAANWSPGRAYASLRAAETIEAVLDRAARGLRTLTGHDRVMAYRFHLDDSGEVLAEARIDALPSFLGQRYPASDIPAQARRLYALNVYRAVVDVDAAPVPVLAAAGEPPIDMSFADLRAVSPIHIEYLRNMGVASTMSLSLMVDGKLWGLLACHHGKARQLPIEIRLMCEAFAHTVSARVSAILANDLLQRQGRASVVREALNRLLLDNEPPFAALDALKERICESLSCDGLIVIQGADFAHTRSISRPDAEAIVQAATSGDAPSFETDGLPIERAAG